MTDDRIAAIRERCEQEKAMDPYVFTIPRLLTEIDRLNAELAASKREIESVSRARDAHYEEWKVMQSELAASKRREQAAVEDIYTLANAASECVICKHRVGQSGCPLRYKNCRFDWRGPQEGGE